MKKCELAYSGRGMYELREVFPRIFATNFQLQVLRFRFFRLFAAKKYFYDITTYYVRKILYKYDSRKRQKREVSNVYSIRLCCSTASFVCIHF